MGIVKGSPTLNILVRKRLDGQLRLFKNVKQATTAGMPYNPADYALDVVKEPGVGYRCVNLPGVIKVWEGRTEKSVPQRQLEGWLWRRGRK